MSAPRDYDGPFDRPPASLLRGANGWRHISRPAGPGRWEPAGWMIVYPDHVMRVGLDGVPYRDSTLHAA